MKYFNCFPRPGLLSNTNKEKSGEQDRERSLSTLNTHLSRKPGTYLLEVRPCHQTVRNWRLILCDCSYCCQNFFWRCNLREEMSVCCIHCFQIRVDRWTLMTFVDCLNYFRNLDDQLHTTRTRFVCYSNFLRCSVVSNLMHMTVVCYRNPRKFEVQRTSSALLSF